LGRGRRRREERDADGQGGRRRFGIDLELAAGEGELIGAGRRVPGQHGGAEPVPLVAREVGVEDGEEELGVLVVAVDVAAKVPLWRLVVFVLAGLRAA